MTLRWIPQKGDADAVALERAGATLLRSGSLRPRIIASLRAASSGFRQLCADYEVRAAHSYTRVATTAFVVVKDLISKQCTAAIDAALPTCTAGRAAIDDAVDLGRG